MIGQLTTSTTPTSASSSIEPMLGASEFTIRKPGEHPDKGRPTVETPHGTLQSDLGPDSGRAAARIKKELSKLDELVAKIKTKLRNEAFRAKAPADVVEKESEKLDQFSERADRLRRNLSVLEPEA